MKHENEDNKILLPFGQSNYTPDVGEVLEGVSVHCGICGALCSEERNVLGPRGFAMAMSGSRSLHDSFMCPNYGVHWHHLANELINRANKEISPTLKEILLKDAHTLIEEKK